MTSPWEAAAGLVLVYFLPGFAITRAIFPERRVFRPWSPLGLVEQLTASVVLSVGASIVVGFAWLGSSVGVRAGWADPLVEVTLAAVAGVALAVAIVRGSFARIPPSPPVLAPEPGTSDPMDLIHELDRLYRTERTLRHRLRFLGPRAPEAGPVAEELDRVLAEAARLRAEREEEYAHD